MPRKSKAEKELLEKGLVVIEGEFGKNRPPAPDDLSDRQKEIWKAIVNDEDVEHFSTSMTREMLKDYIQHREAIDMLNNTISQFQEAWLKNEKAAKRFEALCRMRDLEIRGATSLATKLRLTNQSRYTPRAAALASSKTLKGSKPWEWDPPPDES